MFCGSEGGGGGSTASSVVITKRRHVMTEKRLSEVNEGRGAVRARRWRFWRRKPSLRRSDEIRN